MSKLEYIDTIELPTWATCYLVNGDDSGLTNDDINTIDNWCNCLEYDCLSFDFGNDPQPGFTQYPEFGLACDCEEVKLYGHLKIQ